ncbi:MAG: hypothetical protein WBG71_08980 [Leeuwenhoekiella sp.]
MIKQFFLLFLFAGTTTIYSQETAGKVYARNKPLADVYLLNYTQQKQTVTNADGNFSLPAKIGDSLIVTAPEYVMQHFILEPFQFKEVWVIELTEAINALDEVTLRGTEKAKPFNLKEYDSSFNAAIVQDRKKNPYLYYPQGSQRGIDFLQLAGMIAKLLKNKDKVKEPEYEDLDYLDFQKLFATHNFFNEEFLRKQLQIKEEYETLFFDFCAANGLSERLLLERNQLELIDFLVEQSRAFHKILEESE